MSVLCSFERREWGWAPMGFLEGLHLSCRLQLLVTAWGGGCGVCQVWCVGREHYLLLSCSIPRHMALHLGTGQHHLGLIETISTPCSN